MTLTDIGPLVALINSGDPEHELCALALDDIRLPMMTTWPVFTEAMYLLGRDAGGPGQTELWRFVDRGAVELVDLTRVMVSRCADLMEKYADLPMDLADATLVALAEQRNENLIFTLDSDFAVYRLHGRRKFRIVP